jgi:hypothetical protein
MMFVLSLVFVIVFTLKYTIRTLDARTVGQAALAAVNAKDAANHHGANGINGGVGAVGGVNGNGNGRGGWMGGTTSSPKSGVALIALAGGSPRSNSGDIPITNNPGAFPSSRVPAHVPPAVASSLVAPGRSVALVSHGSSRIVIGGANSILSSAPSTPTSDLRSIVTNGANAVVGSSSGENVVPTTDNTNHVTSNASSTRIEATTSHMNDSLNSGDTTGRSTSVSVHTRTLSLLSPPATVASTSPSTATTTIANEAITTSPPTPHYTLTAISSSLPLSPEMQMTSVPATPNHTTIGTGDGGGSNDTGNGDETAGSTAYNIGGVGDGNRLLIEHRFHTLPLVPESVSPSPAHSIISNNGTPTMIGGNLHHSSVSPEAHTSFGIFPKGTNARIGILASLPGATPGSGPTTGRRHSGSISQQHGLEHTLPHLHSHDSMTS